MKGIGISSGIVIGHAVRKPDDEIIIQDRKNIEPKEEIARLENALTNSLKQIEELCQVEKKAGHTEKAEIFQAHKLILEDTEFTGKMAERIAEGNICCEAAVQSAVQEFIKIFESMDDEYIRARAADIKDIRNRILRSLLHINEFSFHTLPDETILVASDLCPSEIVQIDQTKVKGCVTEEGSKTSHSAIIAKSTGMPIVVAVKGAMREIRDGDLLVLDLQTGEVIVNPDKEALKIYREKEAALLLESLDLHKWVGLRSETADGRIVTLEANIGSLEELPSALKNDAEGIGLFRTEFLYMNSDHFPTEGEQFLVYKKVLETMGDKPVIIRTLDIGGDKKLSYYKLPEESNPFLGVRAIRLCLREEQIFKTQLRALLRASTFGNLKIMFPMISGLQELRQAKKILEDVKQELALENIPFHNDLQVGIMIEIPSAAVISDLLAKECDFFSIGTNDLIQYTIAVDRMNPNVADLYNVMHPAVLRLIRLVIQNGHKQGIRVGMCGEAASVPEVIPYLVYMGLDDFSMNASSILKVRRNLSLIKEIELEKTIVEMINLETR